MGPAVETFLTFVVLGALAIVACLYVFRQPLARVRRYIDAWQRRDEEVELEEERVARLRKEAEREVHSWTGLAEEPQETSNERNQV